MSWRYFSRAFVGCFAVVCASLLSACGGGAGDSAPPPAPAATIALHAGSLQMPGSRDGMGPDAQFSQPEGVAQDAAGNVYVADSLNHTIRKIDPNGAVSTLAGSAGQMGSVDGQGSAARFNFPRGVAVDAAGNVYVADSGNHAVRRITPLGLVSTFAGAAGQEGFGDGPAGVARFGFPTDLALDAAGNLYVASDSAIRKVAPDGTVSTFAGVAGQFGLVAGDGAQARLGFVTGVAVDGAGNVYVSESATITFQNLRRFDPAGHSLPLGAAPGGMLALPFAAGIAADALGNAYVAAGGFMGVSAGIIRPFNSILKVTPQGEVDVLAGNDQESGSTDGPGTLARFRQPSGITVGVGGRLIIADTNNAAIRQIDTQNVVSTIAGGAGIGYVDGVGSQARFSAPGSLAAALDGNVFVVDGENQVIRRISPAGVVSTLQVTAEDGSQPAAFGGSGNRIDKIAMDAKGGLYVSLTLRFGSLVYPISSSGRLGKPFSDEFRVSGMATDQAGNLYLAEVSQVSVIALDGTKRTFATGFKGVEAVAVSDSGTVYVADSQDHTIHAFDPGGNRIFTLGRAGQTGYQDGSNAEALFNFPNVLTLDAAGNLYIADSSDTIRRLSPSGTVSTIAGIPGRSGLQIGPVPGVLGRVMGLAWNAGTLYASVPNAVIRISPLN